MAYNVIVRKRVLKVLAHINEPYYSNIKEAIYNLGENPRPYGYIKLKGSTSFRLRVGDYRIIYDIDDSVRIVDIYDLGNRKEIYN